MRGAPFQTSNMNPFKKFFERRKTIAKLTLENDELSRKLHEATSELRQIRACLQDAEHDAAQAKASRDKLRSEFTEQANRLREQNAADILLISERIKRKVLEMPEKSVPDAELTALYHQQMALSNTFDMHRQNMGFRMPSSMGPSVGAGLGGIL